MDEALRGLEQRLRAAPDDPALLRALAAARERAGDARGAWRARARLARVTDAVEDWRALEPPALAPRRPGAVRVIERAGEVLHVGRDGFISAGPQRLALVNAHGAERWGRSLEVPCELVLPCGPDTLVVGPDRLRLVDRAGDVVGEGPLRAPLGPERWAAITGDRAVVWTRMLGAPGEGERTVLDVGAALGAVVAHAPFDPGDAAGPGARVVAGHTVTARQDGRVAVGRVEAAAPAWSADASTFVDADAAGVLLARSDWTAVEERDLRTGQVRPGGPRAATAAWLAPEHVLALGQWVAEVWRRERREALWSAPGREVIAAACGGSDVVLLRREPRGGLTLAVHDLPSGAERWRAPLPPEVERPGEGRYGFVSASLHMGDGALVVRLRRDPDPSWERVVWVGDEEAAAAG